MHLCSFPFRAQGQSMKIATPFQAPRALSPHRTVSTCSLLKKGAWIAAANWSTTSFSAAVPGHTPILPKLPWPHGVALLGWLHVCTHLCWGAVLSDNVYSEVKSFLSWTLFHLQFHLLRDPNVMANASFQAPQ